MSFVGGFEKVAGLMAGLHAAGKETVHEALTLKGMRDTASYLGKRYKGKLKDLVTTSAGRSELAEGVAKALPSAVAAGAYLKGAKSIYNKAKENNSTTYDQQYQ